MHGMVRCNHSVRVVSIAIMQTIVRTRHHKAFCICHPLRTTCLCKREALSPTSGFKDKTSSSWTSITSCLHCTSCLHRASHHHTASRCPLSAAASVGVLFFAYSYTFVACCWVLPRHAKSMPPLRHSSIQLSADQRRCD